MTRKTKRGSPRQLVAGPELDHLARIMHKLMGKTVLTELERQWLLRLLTDIYIDKDVRDRFFRKRGAPADLEKRARDDNCAQWIAVQSRPGLQGRSTVDQAKFDAEKRFRMTESQVHRAWLAYGKQWKAWAQLSGKTKVQ